MDTPTVVVTGGGEPADDAGTGAVNQLIERVTRLEEQLAHCAPDDHTHPEYVTTVEMGQYAPADHSHPEYVTAGEAEMIADELDGDATAEEPAGETIIEPPPAAEGDTEPAPSEPRKKKVAGILW